MAYVDGVAPKGGGGSLGAKLGDIVGPHCCHGCPCVIGL